MAAITRDVCRTVINYRWRVLDACPCTVARRHQDLDDRNEQDRGNTISPHDSVTVTAPLMVLGGIAFALFVRIQPHYTAWINHMHSGILFNTIFSALIAIIAHGSPILNSPAALIILCIMTPLNITAGYWISKYALFAMQQDIIDHLRKHRDDEIASEMDPSTLAEKTMSVIHKAGAHGEDGSPSLKRAYMDKENDNPTKGLPPMAYADIFNTQRKKEIPVFSHPFEVEIAGGFMQSSPRDK